MEIQELTDCTDYNVLWDHFEKLVLTEDPEYGDEYMDTIKIAFFAGALGAVGVATNRLSELPSVTNRGRILRAISKSLSQSIVELTKINYKVQGKHVGTA